MASKTYNQEWKEEPEMTKNGELTQVVDDVDFEPMWDYILALPIVENVTKAGLVLPDGSRLTDVKKALVIKAGKGSYRESGAFIENPIKPGDTIYMMGHVKPFVVGLNDKNHICLSCRDVIAITKRK